MKTAINAVAILPGDLPDWVALIPGGRIVGRDGRTFLNDNPGKILEAFNTLARDIPIDIEHSTEHKAPNGDPAPAIGWVKKLEARNGEIWGNVEWNASGRQIVEEKSYRYLSPVIIYEQRSGTIVGITSVGATNQPNLKLPALNQQQGTNTPEEHDMLKALLAALALPESTSETEAIIKAGLLKAELVSATNRADNPSLDKFVPRADFDAALAKATNAESLLITMKGEKVETAVNAAISQALKDGKITPATSEYHKAQCMQEGGLDRFTDYCASAPTIGADSGLDDKSIDGDKKSLNSEQKQIAEMFGNSAEDLEKYGK